MTAIVNKEGKKKRDKKGGKNKKKWERKIKKFIKVA